MEEADMSDEAKQETTPVAGGTMDKSIRSVVIFSSVVLWLLAIFMINIMNSINTQLKDLNDGQVSLTNVVGARKAIENYQILDADGNPIYSFRIDPAMLSQSEGREGEELSTPQ